MEALSTTSISRFQSFGMLVVPIDSKVNWRLSAWLRVQMITEMFMKKFAVQRANAYWSLNRLELWKRQNAGLRP